MRLRIPLHLSHTIHTYIHIHKTQLYFLRLKTLDHVYTIPTCSAAHRNSLVPSVVAVLHVYLLDITNKCET